MDLMDRIDKDVQRYFEQIAPEHRPLFDRIHGLILEECPEASVVISYRMPTYQIGKRRLHVGAWKHGLSIYGWKGQEGEQFLVRHPDLRTSKGTIQLSPEAAAAIGDDEFRALARAALIG
jgi:uncharacterized protein YdhG (YjbR/CyaY superfamily)